MELDDIKQAVKEAANEVVGERLDAFESRLATLEAAKPDGEGEGSDESVKTDGDDAITREEFDALKASIGELAPKGEGEGDEGGEIDEAKLAEAVKAFIDEKYGDVLKTVTKSAQPADDGEGDAATKSNARRDAWGRSRRT